MNKGSALPTISYSDLSEKHILVTGSSQGIGRAITLALLEQGALVHGIDCQPADWGEGYTHYICDLSDAEALAHCVEQCVEDCEHQALDGLVNVAGIDPKVAVEDADLQQWQRIIDLDLRAYHLLIHHALGALKRGGLKSIVNLSSINFQLGVPGRGLYSIAKSGIIGLTRGLARELGSDGIRINTVSPGWVLTDRQLTEYFPDTEPGRAALEDLFNNKQSLPMAVQPEDIAAHVLFYLSGISRASTGHNCVVDAGWILQ